LTFAFPKKKAFKAKSQYARNPTGFAAVVREFPDDGTNSTNADYTDLEGESESEDLESLRQHCGGTKRRCQG
jgi:hypothetical protein